ncbi:MAG: TonB-dependent receptor plug domain-containing protein [Oligoflexales bacterium]
MIKRWKKVFVLGILFLNYDLVLQAQEDLSLDDLLNLKVVVTSKQAESLLEAPGVVTVHSESDIDRTGYYTIADLANMTPGYSSQINANAQYVFETRGQTSNNKHLILVDGIPVNYARNYGVEIGHELPVMFAKRIEFLRGPASALYGTGAFFGVVNMVSRDYTKKKAEYFALAEYGVEDDSKRYISSYSRNYGKGSLSMNVGFYKKDATDEPFFEIENNDNNDFRDNAESTFFYAKHTSNKGMFKGTTTGFLLLNQQDGYGYGWNVGDDMYPISYQRTFSFIPYVKYTREVAKNTTFNAYVKYQELTDAGSQSNAGWAGDSPNWWFAYDVNVKNLEYLAEVNYSTEDMGVIFGLNLDRRKHDPNESSLHNHLNDNFPRFSSSMTKTDSIYLQGKKTFGILSGLNLTFGARYDSGSTAVGGEDQTFTQLSPRAAIVQKVTDNLAVKLMSGSALKAPGTIEYNHNNEKSPFLLPNSQPSLNAETIQTTEMAIVWNPKNMIATLSLFTDETKNRINQEILTPVEEYYQDTSGDTPEFYTNVDGTIKSSGGEISVVSIISDFKLGLNHSTAKAELDDGSFVGAVPTAKTNLSVTYKQSSSKRPFSGAIIIKNISGYQNGDGSEYSGFSNIDLNIGKTISPTAKLELAMTNLADTEFYYPDGGGAETFKAYGRNYKLRFKASF